MKAMQKAFYININGEMEGIKQACHKKFISVPNELY